MLIRPFVAYVAGVATVAAAHSAGSGAPGRLGFALGILSTLLVLALVLASSKKRAAATARLLLRIVGPEAQVLRVRRKEPAASKKSLPESRVFADVVLALRSLECNKETARRAVSQATSRLPDGNFEDVFKLAAQIATARTRTDLANFSNCDFGSVEISTGPLRVAPIMRDRNDPQPTS